MKLVFIILHIHLIGFLKIHFWLFHNTEAMFKGLVALAKTGKNYARSLAWNARQGQVCPETQIWVFPQAAVLFNVCRKFLAPQ